MKLEKKRYDDIVILKFTGEFDTFNLPGFSERVENMVEAGDRSFVLDLHLLKFVNSAALGYLIRFSKQVGEQGGSVVLARPSKFLRKTLTTLGLEEVFPIFETVEDAIVHFKKGVDVGRLVLQEGDHDEALTGAVPILFREAEDEEAPNQVGRIVTLYRDGLTFRYEAGGIDPMLGKLREGARLKLKFRQPFAVKDHYFEMDGDVKEVTPFAGGDGSDRALSVRVSYQRIRDEDREVLEQFVRDQETWRAELPS